MASIMSLLAVIIYFIIIGVIIHKIAGYIGSKIGFFEIFKKIFKFFHTKQNP